MLGLEYPAPGPDPTPAERPGCTRLDIPNTRHTKRRCRQSNAVPRNRRRTAATGRGKSTRPAAETTNEQPSAARPEASAARPAERKVRTWPVDVTRTCRDSRTQFGSDDSERIQSPLSSMSTKELLAPDDEPVRKGPWEGWVVKLLTANTVRGTCEYAKHTNNP